MMSTKLRWTWAVLGTAGLIGCAGGTEKPKQAATPRPSDAQAAAGAKTPEPNKPLSTVEVLNLREQALAALEKEFQNGAGQARANAVEAAQWAPARLGGLVEKGLNDRMPGVRAVAAMTVGRAPIPALAGEAGVLLQDPTPHVRASAIFALAKLGHDVDQSPLANMLLEDRSPWVRRHAAFILGELGNKSALPLLRTAARSTIPTATTEQVKDFHLQVAESMIKLGDDSAREAVRAALYPSRPEELESAAFAVQIIGEVKDRASMSQLASLADYKDREGRLYPAEVRIGIAGAMARLGSNDGLRIAEEFRESPTGALRGQAAWVFGEIGGDASLRALGPMLADRDENVRVAAAAAILRATSGTAPGRRPE